MKSTFILAGAVLASTLTSQAAGVVYSTDFTGEEYTQNTGAVVFDDGTTTAVEEWFGSNNGIGIAGGDLSFNNSTANRFRGTGVWLDTSVTGWEAGLVTVEFDVANFVSGADTDLLFQAFAANGVDASNTVSLDLHGAVSGHPVLGNSGTATISALGSEQYITGNGTDVAFTFTYNGTDDFVGLVFAQSNAAGGTAFGSADIDNLSVTVPEPSTYALLAGLTGLTFVMLRRRRA